jgi:F-type H+-transporting ATPase subunit b
MRLLVAARPAVPFALALAALAVVAVGPALSADTSGEKKEGGLSFLDLHRYDLGIFTLIVFGVLCLILYRFAWPKISEGLAKREAAISQAIEDAKAARQETAAMRAQLMDELEKGYAQIRALMDEARRDAEALRAREREAGLRDASLEKERALREIEAARDAALQEIYQRSVKLAGLMSSKAVRRQLTVEDQDRLIQESLDELQGAVGRG